MGSHDLLRFSTSGISGLGVEHLDRYTKVIVKFQGSGAFFRVTVKR